MTLYNIVASTSEATVVAECPPNPYRSDSYQSEADLEREFIKQLEAQGYEFIQIHGEHTGEQPARATGSAQPHQLYGRRMAAFFW